MSDEMQLFRGDGSVDAPEALPQTAARQRTKTKPDTIAAKSTVPDEVQADPAILWQTEAFTEAAHLPARAETPVEPDLSFEIDPDSLWTMPAAMRERIASLAGATTVTNQRLDDAEKTSARTARALRNLQ